jgi:hypothetical protein
VFLLMIGPVDYFVLGWLHRRRYTWVLFPATSIAFVLATTLMANHYLGAHDQHCNLTLVDLDKDGTALRWNRFELIFAGREKMVTTDVTNALWVPLDVEAISVGWTSYTPTALRAYGARPPGYMVGPNGLRPYNNNIVQGAYTYVSGNAANDSGPPQYAGILPSHFQTTEAIHQWQPKLNRILSFEPPPVPLLPDWAAVEAAWPDLHKIRAQLSLKKPFTGGLYAISGLPDMNSPYSVTSDPGSTEILDYTYLSELCAGDLFGPRPMVSQISPNGGTSFDDIRGLDVNDSVLAIVTRSGNDFVVYRRFFYGH